MRIAHDIYAETNPAFCAALLVAFTIGYSSNRPEGAEAPLAYLALPVALSGDFASSFEGTNRNTGLLEWLERSPQVQVRLADRVDASLEIVSEAIRFGCFCRVLTIDKGARLRLGDRKLKESVFSTLGDDVRLAAKHSKRLGYWFATVGSTRSIFDAMGLAV